MYIGLLNCSVFITCADPELFVRGGPNEIFVLKTFLVDEGRGSKYHYQRAIIGLPAKWRFAFVPMMALFCFFITDYVPKLSVCESGRDSVETVRR